MDTSTMTLLLARPQWIQPDCPTLADALKARQDRNRFDRDQDGYRKVDTFLEPFKEWEQRVVAADQTPIDCSTETGNVVIATERIDSDVVNAELRFDVTRGDVGDYLIVDNPSGLPERSYKHRLAGDQEEYSFNACGMEGVTKDSLLIDHKLGTMTLIKQFEPDRDYRPSRRNFF